MVKTDTPTYNLKAVVRETGLKPDTLRAWERRYGVPDPNRTGGGHRLYSQQDINTLKWLLARQEEGMSISRAVRLWQNLVSEGRDPLQVHPLNMGPEPAGPAVMGEMGETVVALRQAWVAACMAYNEREAEQALNQAFAYFSPETVCIELLQKGLVELGNGWYEGNISVQQEHFASALALRRIDSLITATPAPTRAGRILVGCPPGESHTFSPLLLTYLLRRRGWDVIYLGADVPVNQLLATIEQTRPNLVIYSAQLLDTAATLLDVAHFLRDADVPLAFGGYIFSALPELSRRIPGHFLGVEIARIPQVTEQLMVNPPPMTAAEPISASYRAALDWYREQSGMIEAQLQRIFGRADISAGRMVDIIQYLSRNIQSALKLGNLNFIDYNLEWVNGLMMNYQVSPEALRNFLAVYRDTVAQHLNSPAGNLVIDWLDQAMVAMDEAELQPVAA